MPRASKVEALNWRGSYDPRQGHAGASLGFDSSGVHIGTDVSINLKVEPSIIREERDSVNKELI